MWVFTVASEQTPWFFEKAMSLFMLFPSWAMATPKLAAHLPLLHLEDSTQATPWMKVSSIPHHFPQK